MHGFSNVAAARLLMGQRVTLGVAGVLGDTGQIPQALQQPAPPSPARTAVLAVTRRQARPRST